MDDVWAASLPRKGTTKCSVDNDNECLMMVESVVNKVRP